MPERTRGFQVGEAGKDGGYLVERGVRHAPSRLRLIILGAFIAGAVLTTVDPDRTIVQPRAGGCTMVGASHRPLVALGDIIMGDSGRRADPTPAQPGCAAVLTAVARGVRDGLLAVDQEGRLLLMNLAAARLIGWSQDEVLGRTVQEFLLPPPIGATADVSDRPLHRALRTTHDLTVGEELWARKGGDTLAVSYTASPIAVDGLAMGTVLVFRDAEADRRSEAMPAQLAAQELAARARQQAAVAELGQRALAGADLATLMDEAVGLVAHTLDVPFCSVMEVLPEGAGLRIRSNVGWGPNRTGMVVGMGPESQAGFTMAQGSPVIFEDLATETRFHGPPMLYEHGVVSGLSVIIPGQMRPFGIMGAQTTRRRRFTTDDAHFLRAIANVLGAATERVRTEAEMRERLEQRVAERTRDLSTLLDVSHNVASTLELGPLLELILDQLKTLVDYVGTAIFVVDGDCLHMLGYRGPLPREQMIGLRFPISQAPGFQESVRRGGQPVILDDIQHEASPLAAQYRQSANTPRDPSYQYIRSLLVVPLKVKDRVIGAMRIDQSAPGAFTEHQAALAMAIANQAAVAIENARLYAQAQEMAAMEERARLARELHDSVTQMLFSASLIAEVLPDLWARDREGGRKHLEGLRLLTRGALAEMRMLLVELRPSALLEADLGDLIRQLIEAVMGRKRLPITLEVTGSRPLPPEVQVAFYRIAQEALNNIVKHAEASSATVELQTGPAGVDLRVRDDGRGFESAAVGAGHFGLNIMRERAATIGAVCSVESQPGQGTALRVNWRDPSGEGRP